MAAPDSLQEQLRRAARFALHDRRASWHGRFAPPSDNDPEHLAVELSDAAMWPDILDAECAQQALVPGKNGKEHLLTFLPPRHFALRYWCVMILSERYNGLWQIRLDARYLGSASARSLFLGRTSENGHALDAWKSGQRARFLLKFDIRSFYPSISHEVLLENIGSKYADPSAVEQAAMELLPRLLRYRYRPVDSSDLHLCERGLPIGNTTERFFSNLYLSPLDDYLLAQGDVSSSRRLDDIRVYGNDRERLEEIQDRLDHISHRLRVEANLAKTTIVAR